VLNFCVIVGDQISRDGWIHSRNCLLGHPGRLVLRGSLCRYPFGVMPLHRLSSSQTFSSLKNKGRSAPQTGLTKRALNLYKIKVIFHRAKPVVLKRHDRTFSKNSDTKTWGKFMMLRLHRTWTVYGTCQMRINLL
jgi:hypothetical protein